MDIWSNQNIDFWWFIDGSVNMKSIIELSFFALQNVRTNLQSILWNKAIIDNQDTR